MKANERFLRKPKSFWASVRSLSQHIGYPKKGKLLTPSLPQMCQAFRELELDENALLLGQRPTALACELLAYFEHRADVLTRHVEPRLMDAAQARAMFEDHLVRLAPKCPLPMNKQKGENARRRF